MLGLLLVSGTCYSVETLDEILTGIEKCYSPVGFEAKFTQKSTIKAMDITDSAKGAAIFKRPGKMKWTYEEPEAQKIITDGTTLWVYKPDENQVTIGQAPEFFGDGKGASFLSDIKLIRKKFNVSLVTPENKDKASTNDNQFFTLKLIPLEATTGISSVVLLVSQKDYTVTTIKTYNEYNDETVISFQNIQFKEVIEDKIFNFKTPEGADVLSLDK